MWKKLEIFLDGLNPYAANLFIGGIAILSGLILRMILSKPLKKYVNQQPHYSLFRSILIRLGKPLTFFLPLLILKISIHLMVMNERMYNIVDKLVTILLIVSIANILINIIKVCEDYVFNRYDIKNQDNLAERKIRTQLQFLRNIGITLIVILSICAILLSFDSLRNVGSKLLTGVGVGGIIIGFAAQRSLGNLLAGLQIAFTQPIRIDDAIVVENEWGKVEEITLTYVVVRIWDQRRLILPINYFIEKPFQNWTRTSSDILGTISLFLDYSAPVEELRKEFNRLIEGHNLWDKRVNVVQVVNTTDRTMEIRFLVSASSSGAAFDLRCYLRENLVAFIQSHHPYCLPKTRTVVDEMPSQNGHENPSKLSTASAGQF
jgi:small-conductance mechanosensitive channel